MVGARWNTASPRRSFGRCPIQARWAWLHRAERPLTASSGSATIRAPAAARVRRLSAGGAIGRHLSDPWRDLAAGDGLQRGTFAGAAGQRVHARGSGQTLPGSYLAGCARCVALVTGSPACDR